MLRVVASSCASLSAAPSSRKVTRLRSVAASHSGRGKLPIVVVAMGGSCIDHLCGFSLPIYAPKKKDKLGEDVLSAQAKILNARMPCCLEADDGAMVGALWCVNEASKAGVT